MSDDTTRTRDLRPWWWWLNPWLYIKRRDIAYDEALDIIYESQHDDMYPWRKAGTFDPHFNRVMTAVAELCPACGRKYVAAWIEETAKCSINPIWSGVCSRGTKACDVKHGEAVK